MNKKIVSLFLAICLIAGAAVPAGTVFAASNSANKAEKNDELTSYDAGMSNGESLSDWSFEETADSVILTKYKGTSTDVIIPGIFNGKQVKIKIQDFSDMFDRFTVTSIKIGAPDQKVQLTNKSLKNAFFLFEKLESANLTGLDTSGVTDMSRCFSNCTSLKNLDISNWDTSEVTTMVSMFALCRSLPEIDMSKFDTGKLRDVTYMFNGCNSLTSLDVTGLNLTGAKIAYRIFQDCSSLTSIDVSSWDMSNVTDPYEMFKGCNSIKFFDLKNWDFNNLHDMHSMFDASGPKPIPTLILATHEKLKDGINFQAITGRTPYKAKVTYDANGGLFEDGKDKKEYTVGGKLYAYPDLSTFELTKEELSTKKAPIKDGETFNGWYLDEECTIPLGASKDIIDMTFGLTLPDDAGIVIYAGWQAQQQEYTVKYDTQGGNQISDRTGVHFTDNNLLPGSIPVKEGHKFIEWTFNGKAVDNASTYESLAKDQAVMSITLTAKWEKNKYSIGYEFVTGEAPEGVAKPADATVEHGQTAADPSLGTYEGWNFDGWYTDKNLTDKFDFNTPVTSDMTLYGKWTKEQEEKPDQPEFPGNDSKPNTPAEPSDWIQSETTVPKTADNTDLNSYAYMMGLSVLAYLAVAIISKRKCEE